MATYEQVLEALRRADAAGNTEDAKQLAAMAIQMRPRDIADVRPATSTGEVLAEGVRRAVAGTPSFIAGLSAIAGQSQLGQPGLVELMKGKPTTGGMLQSEGYLPMEPRPSPGESFVQAQQGTQRAITGLLGGGNVRPTTEGQKYLMSFVEGAADPLNLLGGVVCSEKGSNLLRAEWLALAENLAGKLAGNLVEMSALLLAV